MVHQGFGWPFLVFQIVNVLLLLLWIVLIFVALFKLRDRHLGEVAHVLWVLVILIVPVLGALAFLITRPGEPRQT